MARTIQAKLDKLTNREKAKTIVTEFCKYMNQHAELEKESVRIPKWRFFKKNKNLRKRERLTRDFKSKLFNLGLFV